MVKSSLSCLVSCGFTFAARLMIVGLLIKSSVDMLLVNVGTPKLIVSRAQYLLSHINSHVYLD